MNMKAFWYIVLAFLFTIMGEVAPPPEGVPYFIFALLSASWGVRLIVGEKF